ncbi:unnamed protein product [Ectocarpus fasciculatus]
MRKLPRTQYACFGARRIKKNWLAVLLPENTHKKIGKTHHVAHCCYMVERVVRYRPTRSRNPKTTARKSSTTNSIASHNRQGHTHCITRMTFNRMQHDHL